MHVKLCTTTCVQQVLPGSNDVIVISLKSDFFFFGGGGGNLVAFGQPSLRGN